MTDPISRKTPSKDDFHKERSRFLDAFAALEEAIANHSPDQTLSKELKALQMVRNDLVHARLRFANVDGQLHAIVVNVRDEAGPARPARLVKLDDFKQLSADLSSMKQRLSA